MNPKLKSRLEAMGFRQTGTIALGQRQIPVFDMKQVKDTLKPNCGQTRGQGETHTQERWSDQ